MYILLNHIIIYYIFIINNYIFYNENLIFTSIVVKSL